MDTQTRLLFIGDEALGQGFRLVGFELLSVADAVELDALLTDLQEQRQRAFVVLDPDVAVMSSAMLDALRAEGGRIVVTEVPPLNRPEQFDTVLGQRIHSLMGGL